MAYCRISCKATKGWKLLYAIDLVVARSLTPNCTQAPTGEAWGLGLAKHGILDLKEGGFRLLSFFISLLEYLIWLPSIFTLSQLRLVIFSAGTSWVGAWVPLLLRLESCFCSVGTKADMGMGQLPWALAASSRFWKKWLKALVVP